MQRIKATTKSKYRNSNDSNDAPTKKQRATTSNDKQRKYLIQSNYLINLFIF
mgnify:CR=1 FL=1|jgi:hypothetical protein